MEEDIPYYKDYLVRFLKHCRCSEIFIPQNNAIRGGIVSACFLSIFIVSGIVNKFRCGYFEGIFILWNISFRWKDEDSIHGYDVSRKADIIEHNDVVKVLSICQDFDADVKIDTEKACVVSDEETEKSTSSKADDESNGELNGFENPALELEEKWFEINKMPISEHIIVP